MKTLYISLAVIAISLFGVSAKADTLDDIRSNERIRVGMDVGFAPFSYRDPATGEIVGSDVTVAEMLARDLGVELEIVPLTPSNRVPFLLSSRVDVVISTLTRTPARLEVIAMSRPYGGSFDIVAARRDVDLDSMEDLAGKRIAITRGTYLDQRLSELAPAGTEIVRFDGEDLSFAAVTSGQFDIVGKNIGILDELNRRSPNQDFEQKFVISELPMSVGLRQGDDQLLEWIDNWILERLEDGSLEESFAEFQSFSMPDFVKEWQPE